MLSNVNHRLWSLSVQFSEVMNESSDFDIHLMGVYLFAITMTVIVMVYTVLWSPWPVRLNAAILSYIFISRQFAIVLGVTVAVSWLCLLQVGKLLSSFFSPVAIAMYSYAISAAIIHFGGPLTIATALVAIASVMLILTSLQQMSKHSIESGDKLVTVATGIAIMGFIGYVYSILPTYNMFEATARLKYHNT